MAAMMSVLAVDAETVLLQEAKNRAQQFLQQQGRKGSLTSVESRAAKARGSHDTEAPCYYVFNVGKDEGFVIIAGDELAPQVLGYSNRGSIDMDHLPCNMQEWFEACEAQIRYMRENNIPAVTPQATKRAIAPLVKVGWDQTAPYNILLPTYTQNGQTGRCATGCVATAMAQAMSVYRYPDATVAAIPSYSYTQSSANKRVNVTGVSAGSTIAWNNIKNTYSGNESSAAKQAIATLMQYCGKSVEMWYDASSSALVADIPKALKQYFGYSSSVAYKYRNNGYSFTQWEDMVYNELDAGRPVILSGKVADKTTAAGHAFVCDGYDGNGRYHINWGWSNEGDDYFVLNMLKPSTFGTGGVSGSFNYHQEAVIGIEPAAGMTPSVRLTVNDFALTTTIKEFQGIMVNGVKSYGPLGFKMTYVNKLPNTYLFDLNIGVYQNGRLLEVLCDQTMSNTNRELWSSSQAEYSWNGHYLPGGTTVKCFSQPGTYMLMPVSRKSGTTEWLVNSGAEEHYITGVVSSNGTLTLTVYGENTPIDPEAGISSKEKSMLESQIENHRTMVEGRMATVQEYMDQLSLLSSRAQDTEDSYYATRLKYTELLEMANLYGLNDYALTLNSAIQMLDNWNASNDYIGKSRQLVSESMTICGTYMSSMRTLLKKIQQQATNAGKMSTKVQYDQLRVEVDGFDEELALIEGLNDIFTVQSSISKGDLYIKAVEASLQSYSSSYDTLLKAMTDKIENDAALKERKQLVEECQELFSWISYYRNMIQEGQDKTNSNKTALLNLILMQGEALDVEKAKLATAGERLSAIVLPEEQLTSLRQAYEKLDGQVTWLSERIANSREQYENLQPVDENRLSEIIRRMEVLRGEMSRAATTEDVAAIKDELAALQEETSTMSDLCKAQSDQLRMMVGDAENWSQEIRTISKGITELNKSLDEAEILAEHLAAELKASQTELLEKVKSSENVLASLENRLSECHTSVDFYEQNYKLVETRFDEVKKVCNEVLELMKNPVLTEDQLKDFEARYELIFYGYRQIVKNVSSEAIDSFNTSEQSVLNDIQHLRSKLQQLREKIIAAKLMSDLLDVNDAVQVTRADVEKTYAQTSEFMLTFEDFVKSYPFDEIQSNLSIVQGQFETLKADMETVITSIGTVVINGKVVTSCRDASGRPASPRQKGLVFIQFADGTVKKVYNK